jgi:hypothetical protein
LISPAFSGTPTTPTAAVNTNNTQIASTAFVVAQIADDAPTKTGGGASGTWAINITGSAASATTAANGGVTSVNGMTGAVSIASAGSPSTAQVLSATAAAGAGDVGTYAMAFLNNGPSPINFGQTTAGSNLIASSAGGFGAGTTTLSGTWRCMGYAERSASSEVTLWLRVS